MPGRKNAVGGMIVILNPETLLLMEVESGITRTGEEGDLMMEEDRKREGTTVRTDLEVEMRTDLEVEMKIEKNQGSN